MTRRIRLALLAAAVIAAAVGGIGAVASASSTQAAWTDRTYTSATVTSGTWSVTPTVGCTAMNSAGTAVGTCSVSSITYSGWGSEGNHTRNYYITFAVSSAATSYIVFTVDLGTAVGSDNGTGAWKWSTAATLNSSQITPTSACSALPKLSGRTVAGWNWTPSNTVYFQATDNKAGNAGSVSCS